MLYLPPYSPDLNPIEQAFAKLETFLRKAAARTRDALWDTISTLLDTFTEAEGQNYLAHADMSPCKPKMLYHYSFGLRRM